MKKLGKLNLKPEKMLSHEELVNFRGGSGDVCENCLISAAMGCDTSCGGGGCDYWTCFFNQKHQCEQILGCSYDG